ncbi:MAG: hypothetical protein WAJ93_09435 [Candidatus Nitrosopolaris sp.]
MNGHPANVKTRDTLVAALTFTAGFIDALIHTRWTHSIRRSIIKQRCTPEARFT